MRIFKTASSSNISDKETSTKKPTGSFKQCSENSQKAFLTNTSDQETSTKKPTGSSKQFSDTETSTKKPTDCFKQCSENSQTAPPTIIGHQETSTKSQQLVLSSILRIFKQRLSFFYHIKNNLDKFSRRL